MYIRNRSGNIMVLVLVFIAVMGFSLSSMIDYTLSQKRQTVRTDHILELKFALDSTVDFVLFGLKQKYCFNNNLMSDTKCDMTHTGSTERLIMSQEQTTFLVVAGKISSAQADTLRLAKISRDLDIGNVTPAHPLYSILSTIKQQPDLADIKFVHVDIERRDSPFLPRSGNEVYLSVTVSLNKTANGGSTLTVGNQKLMVASNLVIYPREIGSFALLIPRDMYVGSNAAPAFGDSHFFSAASKDQFSGSQGLLFTSPVFVNRDIILNSTGYSPVTFAERVYMGSGKVLSGSSPFKPASNGADGQRYWRDVTSFGGFLKGLENDGALDAGLNAYIGNTVGAPPPSNDLMSRCIDRNLSQSDLSKILNSSLTLQTAASGAGFTYLLKLTNSEFEGQDTTPKRDTSHWGSGSLNVNNPGKYQKTIIDLTLKVGGLSTTFSLSKMTDSNSTVQVGSPQYEGKLRAALSAATKALEDALAKQNDPDAGGSAANIQALRAAVLAAQDKLDKYLYAVAHPPVISISTNPVARSAGDSKSKVNFSVTVSNPSSLIGPNGEIVSPEVSMKAYDNSYLEGGFIGNRWDSWRRNNGTRFTENQKLARTLDFTINPTNSQVTAPAGVTPATGADYEDLGDQCMSARDALESQAFGMADANVSFASSTRNSWNFAGTGSETAATKSDPLISSITFDGSNAVFGAGNATFQVRSIVGTCTIKASANFVTGFFACDKLVIEQRNRPLRIIATIIAGSVNIHPSAYQSGIVWSSIYHPQAVQELRKDGILKRISNGGACVKSTSSPIWNPVPSIQEVADRMTCNVISLRAKADPFQWTSIDPDCGMLAGNSNMVCKKRLVRFFIVEQSREDAR
jgi:hypothetical protein